MQYLGRIWGAGVLTWDGEENVRASYDFEGFFKKPAGMTSCGEIRTTPAALKRMFGRKDVQLLTDDGRLLRLEFSDKKLTPTGDSAHVDVTGQLPALQEDGLRWCMRSQPSAHACVPQQPVSGPDSAG